jgi:pantetheine-phosphate adenylyltransferase
MTIAIYQGSFDPLTSGHLDVVVRASKMFERLVIGVFDTPDKLVLFNTQERMDLCRRSTESLPNVEVRTYTGLTVDFAHDVEATAMVRGLRSISDFDNEFAMDMMNRNLNPDLTTVYLITRTEYTFVSSTLIKEVARYGGNVHNLVPDCVADALQEKLHLSV